MHPLKSYSILKGYFQPFAYDWIIRFLVDLEHGHETRLISLSQISHDDFL